MSVKIYNFFNFWFPDGQTQASRSFSKEDKDMRKQLAEQAKLNAERVKKYGVCMVPLRLALLFGGQFLFLSLRMHAVSQILFRAYFEIL